MKLDILAEAIERCLDEMYRYAQPSITFKEFEELCRKEYEENNHTPQPVYLRYYLSPTEEKVIIEKYIKAYNLENPFKDHCDLIINDMMKGCSKDKYIPADGDTPGHRSYEQVPSLDKEIGEENLKKVIDFINMRRDFYHFDRKESTFRFNVSNIAPNSNKEKVIEYWKSKGVDLQIEEHNDEDECFDVHYYEMTWDDYRRECEEIN